MNILKKLFVVLVILLIAGCGKSNILEGLKPADANTDSLETAKQAIDEGKYGKAKNILDDYLKNKPADKEANILYGQAQMGLAEVDLATILIALSSDSPTPSLCKLNDVCNAENRGRIYEAADRFINYAPTDTSDKVIAALCGMIAYTAIIHDTFDTADNSLQNDTGDLAENAPASPNWNSMNGQHNQYMALATNSLASLSNNKDIEDAVTSMNATMEIIDLAMIANPDWALVKSQLLSF